MPRPGGNKNPKAKAQPPQQASQDDPENVKRISDATERPPTWLAPQGGPEKKRPVGAPQADGAVLEQKDADYKSNRDEQTNPMSILEPLATKGFCLVNKGITNPELLEAHHNIRQLDSAIDFQSLPFTIRNGLLGQKASASSAELPDKYGYGDEKGLHELCKLLVKFGEDICEFSVPMGFGFQWHGNFEICRTGAPTTPEAAPITSKTAQKWFPTFLQQKLMCMIFLGPGDGRLELKPHQSTKANPISLHLKPGSIVLVRTDLLLCTLECQDRACSLLTIFSDDDAQCRTSETVNELDEWIRSTLKSYKEKNRDLDVWATDLPRSWQDAMNHLFIPTSYLPLMGHGIKCPSSNDSESWFAATTAGADVITEVCVINNWDHTKYYDNDPDCWRSGKSYCKHAGFADGLDQFDPAVFGLPAAEAKWMAPHQRMILEVGYTALHEAGFSKKQLMNSAGAHICGFGDLQWNFVSKSDITNASGGGGGAYSACGEAASIVAARLSFCFGMKGNCFVVDTEASSGLTAVHACSEAIQPKTRQPSDAFAVATATYLNLTPTFWPSLCAAGLLTRTGRCMTFDLKADGYAQSDGVAALCITRQPEPEEGATEAPQADDKLGLLASSVMNHNGGSASLSAPKGPAQQEVILEAVQAAQIYAADVDAVECHGAGNFLADAIEAGSVSRSHRNEKNRDPLCLMVGKTDYGHMVHSAGLNAFLKVLFNQLYGTLVPINHLRSVNTHCTELIEEMAVSMSTECCPMRKFMGSYCGTMARGFGGTNVYVISHGDNKRIQDDEGEEVESCERAISYWPGGGGQLEGKDVPLNDYQVAGAFNGWEPQPMERHDGNLYFQSVTVDHEGWTDFQIWLDGDFERVLHPNTDQGFSGSAAYGPHAVDIVPFSVWIIEGEPFQQFTVQLEINGLWRKVTWEPAPEENEAGEASQ